MRLDNKKSGFTLSEIMVAIVTIGFLATLTLSTVGASIQTRSRLSQFRAAYARMDAVLRSITAEEGIVYQCYSIPTENEKNNFGLNVDDDTPDSSDAGCRALIDKFVRAMGATRFCEGDAQDNGCLPANYPTAEGCFENYSNVGSYVLDNSMIITTDDIGSLRRFFVDVNGRKGPNKWGQDIFVFSIKAVETVKNGDNVFVTQLGILPGDVDGCAIPVVGASSKSTLEMLKESAGFKSVWRASTDTNTENNNNNNPGNLGNFGQGQQFQSGGAQQLGH